MTTPLPHTTSQPDLFLLLPEPSLPSTRSPYAQQTIRRAIKLLEKQLREPGVPFLSTSATRDWLRLKLAGQERELFPVMYLDNQHRLITHETLFSGTINCTSVYPREVVKSALKHNAAAVIVAHNHPSGLAEPGEADRKITERLKQALDLVDIRLLDHLVVGGMDIVSFAERGWL
ncbi:DNA repair protein RadC [Citrobacter freundii]|uniref:RadC family protein n=1 Tax=Citrobacter freundii TaxID=546 RepID=UPI0024E0B6A5|nr:DNA repair protein RadC [Citrobacter freundii]EKV5092635.1 DNA repair protein RadC [Citrobacter freundii]ELN4556658.1 DNA repair protein RadC [Citrobacter freundii]MDT7261851.1 DNA repair protein RadC [Citrobacter freundii]WOR59869.1 DNA repair protein RadC [Citrobacter freundii]HBM8272654.1 DNA repair protein RadC [Citrobacter freundii]